MANQEEKLAKEVSAFLHKSYQELPAHRLGLGAFLQARSYPADHPVDDIKCRVFPVVTGSRAEFYIDSMLKCFGDTDVMYHYNNELAMPLGHQPPIQLPKKFASRVNVFEIVDSHVPGYVYLHMRYILSNRKTDGQCIIAENVNRPNTALSHELYVTAGVRERAEIHGPSACASDEDIVLTDGNPRLIRKLQSIDTVPCIRCLVWPKQADTWPTRHRNYDWPDSETVVRVVSNGCDVVGVAHTLCAQDEWMSKHQWRLSFSRAEVVLLNSWIPTQQMIYHMLRIFMKTERLLNGVNNTGKSMFSNYHIKTAMLWACERRPQIWWTDSTNLVSLFAQCLHFLEKWITKNCGRHYFVKNVHFKDYIDTLSMNKVIAVVNSTTEDCLAEWFVDNYMRKCVELCPDNLPILYSDVATTQMVHDTATAILRWKKHIFAIAWWQRCFALYRGFGLASFRSWEVPLLRHLLSVAQPPLLSVFKQDRQQPDLNYTVSSFLHIVLNTADCKMHAPVKNRIDDFFVLAAGKGGRERDINIYLHAFLNVFLNATDTNPKFPFKKAADFVSLLFGRDDRIRRFDCTSSNDNESKAVVWMKEVADRHPNTHEVVDVYLAKEYLVRAMRCKDSDSDSVYDVANVYLAVLCYITGEYQKAADHCALVTRSQGCSQCSSGVVDGELLPKIDDDIDTVLGLAVFYHYVQTTVLKQVQHTQHASVFTTELFALYFSIRHLLVVNCHLAREKHALRKVMFHLREEMKLFDQRIVSTPRLFVTDIMMLKFSNNSNPCQFKSIGYTDSDSCNRRQLVELLTQTSIQHLLSYRQLMLSEEDDREFVAIVTSSDFTAVRLYRCKFYERCMQICQRAVNEMIEDRVRPITRLCFMHKEFVQLMDDTIVSLIGMTVLVDKSGSQSKSKLKEPLNISQLTMSLYLLTQCQLNVFYSKWKPDISPLADILDLIGEAEKLIPPNDALDRLILKLAERLSVMYVTKRLDSNSGRKRSAVMSYLRTFFK